MSTNSGNCQPVYRDGTFWIYVILVVATVIMQNSLMGSATTSTWYTSLKKPALVPPNYFFTLIWTLIYFLLAWSTFLGSRSARNGSEAMLINLAFCINLVLNILWTTVFFRQHNPQLALWILIILFLETLWLSWLIYRTNKMAGAVFVIYLIWLAIAIYYNWTILRRNPKLVVP